MRVIAGMARSYKLDTETIPSEQDHKNTEPQSCP